MGSLETCLLFFVMVMFMSATMSRASTSVVIYNDLGGGLPLRHHCKSREDDLGYQSLAPGRSWSFGFTPDIFGRTLFYCRFSWGAESHIFDIYKQSRDKEFQEFGCKKCEWKIRKNGPCKFYKKTGMFDHCYSWD
ncbi:putative plant self-incompatibility S1 [Arabidopsis thaliana]|uniref:S-protein homolog n=3 Tax=Arabidopsis TaxID=3701 RepID=A0A178VK74_ARATH|nr:Plant self-incompatibility S1 [Arabidopsis thaliana x Arabidopsis arenosa]KAG7631552.1 Plant self-incompatibility S1 [Arabidopsis suecica]OAP06737.1 hypothetical protein AXX17_AT3G17960 [Arabidopsis thaliana]